MNFFILRNGNKQGPYLLESLPEMNRNGNVLPSDHIWVEGAPSWVPISDYMGTKAPAGPPPLSTALLVSAPDVRGAPPLPPSSGATDSATVELVKKVEAGGRFVIFPYCISILILSFKRGSTITFLRRDQDGAGPAIGYSLLSGLVGWWGIPWGPIWTIAALISNARGGKDVTLEVLTDKVGPTAAAAILARRQKPARAGWLMNSFRVALVAVPVLFFAPIVIGLMGGFENSSSPRVQSAFDEANRQIGVNHGAVAFGNSSRAIAVAGDVSRSMKTLRELGFEGGKKNGFSVSNHEFLTYCDLREGQCIVLIHVPELRRFTAEAKDSLAAMAWGQTQTALRQRKAGTPGMKLVVGLRGIALYDRAIMGDYVSDPEAKDSGLKETLKDGRDELERAFDRASQRIESGRPAVGASNTNGIAAP